MGKRTVISEEHDVIIVSVVVPFFRGMEYLDRTLAGLSRQSLPSRYWEVVISEDGSPEPTNALINTYSGINVRRVRIERNGFRLATARNGAIQSSLAPIILLLDFDCVPLPTHVERHLALLRASRFTATVGLRRFVDLNSVEVPQILHETWWESVEDVPSISSGGLAWDKRIDEIEDIATHPCPSNLFHGCNVGFWRATAQEVGLFNEEFNGAHGYEDLEFAWRLQQAGVRFAYVGTPVFHQENLVVGEDQRSEGRVRNYATLARLAPGLVEFRERYREVTQRACAGN
jgi:chondroitin synthase